MFWYFEVTIKNIKTGQDETFDASINNGNYFDAYKKIIDAAKSYIDEKDDKFSWVVASIEDVTRY